MILVITNDSGNDTGNDTGNTVNNSVLINTKKYSSKCNNYTIITKTIMIIIMMIV